MKSVWLVDHDWDWSHDDPHEPLDWIPPPPHRGGFEVSVQ